MPHDPRILQLDGFSLDEESESQGFRFLSDTREPLRALEQESDTINQRCSVECGLEKGHTGSREAIGRPLWDPGVRVRRAWTWSWL